MDSKLNEGYNLKFLYLYLFSFFLQCEKDRDNLTTSSNFLCNFCTFDMVRVKPAGKETREISI